MSHAKRTTLLCSIGVIVALSACTSSTPQGQGSSATLPTSSPTSLQTLPTSPSPSPTPTLPAGFVCGGASGGEDHASDWGPAGPKVTAVRAGQHTGFDRFVIEFDGTIPTYRITMHAPTFTLSPSGKQVSLGASHAILIRLKPQDWTAYGGPKSLQTGFQFLREARLVENFEGTMQWGLAIEGVPCLRVTKLGSPPRLVVDVVGLAAPLSFGKACTSRVLLPLMKQDFDSPSTELFVKRVDIHRCRNGYAYLTMFPRKNPPGHSQYDPAQVYLRYADGWWRIIDVGTGIGCTEPGLAPADRRACKALGYLS